MIFLFKINCTIDTNIIRKAFNTSRFIESLNIKIINVEKPIPTKQIDPYETNLLNRLLVFLKFKNVLVGNENANPHNAPMILTCSGDIEVTLYKRKKIQYSTKAADRPNIPYRKRFLKVVFVESLIVTNLINVLT